MRTEAEMGVMLPQAKRHPRPPETRRGGKAPPPDVRGGVASLLLDLRLLASRTVTEHISVLSHAVCGDCYSSLRKLLHYSPGP